MNNSDYSKINSKVSDLINFVFTNTPTVGACIVAGTFNKIYYKEPFGVVHSSSNSKVSLSTLFDIQSITKMVATISLLEKFISLDKLTQTDSVQKYLPNFNGLHKSEVKIQDLVLHQSGISDSDFLDENLQNKFNNANELWENIFNTPLHYEPGSSIEYSDIGYRLLGLCLEQVGGEENLDLLCKKYVWQQLDMPQTTYNITSASKDIIAGHGDSWGFVDDSQDRLLNKPLGCDGVFSSANDLINFSRNWLLKLSDSNFFQNLMKISAGHFDSKWSFYESLGSGKKVFGWEQHHVNQSYIGSRHTDLTIEKAGGAGAFLCLRPEKQDFFIYLTNYGRPDPFTMNSWNKVVTDLKVREIAEIVLKK